MFGASKFPQPAFILNAPFSMSSAEPNNIWMEDLLDGPEEDRVVDLPRALDQWMNLYNYIASQALVYVLPSVAGLQDQVYVANLGIVLPHLNNKEVATAVISNYRSEPRYEEAPVGVDFLKSLGFEVHHAPKHFEGEADLKYIKDNVYVGAHGMRTSLNTLEWFEKEFDMEVIKVEMTDPRLYHLDCLFFPLSNDSAMACTALLSKACIKQMEKHFRIVDVPLELASNGVVNNLRLGRVILSYSEIDELDPNGNLEDKQDYKEEKEAIHFLETVAYNEGFDLKLFNLSEFTKSGAMLSCCVMRLNYLEYTR